MVSIAQVDPHDEPAFRAVHDVLTEGASAGREAPVMTSYEAMLVSMQSPSPRRTRALFGAYVDAVPVGAALLERQTHDNLHLAGLEVDVPPRHRGAGVGTALFEHAHAVAVDDDRTTFICEAYVPAGLALEGTPGGRFAVRHGFSSAHEEDHLVLDLPAEAPAAHLATGYEVVSWVGRCRDDHVEAYARMRTAMSSDVPTGEIDMTPVPWDVARVRENEERMQAQGYAMLVTAARDRSGDFGGYTEILVPEHVLDEVYQDDTLVLSDHRGNRLGAALKAANMAVLAQRFPHRRLIHTWTARDNGPMQAINRAFGFRVVEAMHEVQRVDGLSG